MYLWELLARRLRGEGWMVTHAERRVEGEASYEVRVVRPGSEWIGRGPTLTEAYAEAARRARRATPASAGAALAGIGSVGTAR